MSLLPPPAQVARVTLSGTFVDTTWANIFHLFAAGMDVSDVGQMTDFLTDLIAAFESSEFYDAQSNELGVTVCKGVFSDGTDLYSQEIDGSPIFAGTDDGGPWSGGVAALVNWHGAWHYRGGKPRTYLPGLTEGWADAPGLLDGSHVASLAAAASALMVDIAAMSGSYGSAVSLGVLLGNSATEAGTFAPFTGVSVQSRPCSQRRRNRPTL